MPIFVSDKSERTVTTRRYFWIVVAILVTMIISLFMTVAGCQKYNGIMSRSSTPVGTNLKFSKTKAALELSGLYTDRNEDVMIARLTPDSNANEILPYRGTDYSVFVRSDSTDGMEELPILFGKMSTDGDMFLIVPKPTDDVYSFAIVNPTGEVSVPGGSSSTGEKDTTNLDDQKRSIASALSEFERSQGTVDEEDEEKESSKRKTGGKYDTLGFKLTMNPSAEGPEYEPTRLEADLFDPQSGEFNFEEFFNKVYVDTAIEKLTDQYNTLEAKLAQQKDTSEQMLERLQQNPDDAVARDNYDKLQSTIEQTSNEQDGVVKHLTDLDTLQFDPSLFQHFQDTATVVTPQ